MGLFSIFQVREPRQPCGRPADPSLAAAPAFAQVGCGVATFTRFALGERGGTRTLDPMIKSHVLYRLSYALTWGVV